MDETEYMLFEEMCSHVHLIGVEVTILLLESPHDTPIVYEKLLCGWTQDTPVVDDHKTIAVVIHCSSI